MRSERAAAANTPRFSRIHAFTGAAVAEAAEIVAVEHPGKRLLMTVTMGHRSQAQKQSAATIAISALAMVSLCVVELAAPSISSRSLALWACGTFLNIAVRVALNLWVFATPPGPTVRSVVFRCLPLLIASLAVGQWVWCTELFAVQGHLGPILIIFTGLTGTSVVMAGMWPTAPLAVVLFLAGTWLPLLDVLALDGSLNLLTVVFVAVGVMLVIAACIYFQASQVRDILDRSDQVDLLLADLHRANADLLATNRLIKSLRDATSDELGARTRFFSEASHDFKQRLHAMKLLANSAVETTSHSRYRDDGLQRLADAVEDVEHYVSNVLDFARLDVGPVVPDRKRLPVQHLFQRLELSFEDVAIAADVDLVFRSSSIVLSTDGALLQRILENLVSNALRHSKRKVLVAARRRGQGVSVEVWDQGPGILLAEQKSIFMPFIQATGTATVSQGVGLGLAVVSRLSECLGYDISVRSRLGAGSVFAIGIPQHDVQPTEGP
jgi:signal transduction histidine kinase